MQMQRINITIPYHILKHLQESIPFGKRSRFIAEAVIHKLSNSKTINQRFAKSLKQNKNLYAQIEKDWKQEEIETWPK